MFNLLIPFSTIFVYLSKSSSPLIIIGSPKKIFTLEKGLGISNLSQAFFNIHFLLYEIPTGTSGIEVFCDRYKSPFLAFSFGPFGPSNGVPIEYPFYRYFKSDIVLEIWFLSDEPLTRT